MVRSFPAALALALIAFASVPASAAPVSAKYLVFTVDRAGTVRLASSDLVTLAEKPESDGMAAFDNDGAERVACDVVDAAGRVIFRRNVVIERQERVEWADPQTGEMHSEQIELDEAAFVVRVPAAAAEAMVVTHGGSRQSQRFDIRAVAEKATIAPNALIANPANRLDILIMGDGYTSQQQSKFQIDAANFISTFDSLPPYSTYANYMTMSSHFVASNQSGADHPVCTIDGNRLPDALEGTFVDTAFDATYCSSGLQRLLTINRTKVLTAAAAVPDWDKIFILVNDTFYGGSGGTTLVGSLASASTNIIQHEFGHSFTRLADEYTSSNPGYPTCSDLAGPAPCEPNVTNQATLGSIKWGPWISASTPVPTPANLTNLIGLFQGARYEPLAYYRPKFDCLMNHLGVPFCEVCRQSFILRLYQGWTTSGGAPGSPANGIDMIEPGSERPPAGAPVTASTGTPIDFSFALLQPVGGPAASIQWSVDGVAISGATATTFQYTPSAGNHTVRVRVADTTAAVHAAMAGASLVHERTWNMVQPPGPGGPRRRTVRH
jgi:hypothetical protein